MTCKHSKRKYTNLPMKNSSSCKRQENWCLTRRLKIKSYERRFLRYFPQEKLQAIVEECGKIIRPTNDKYFDFLSTRYSYLQQFVPKFLDSFVFQSKTKDDALLAAIDTIRQMNATNQRKLPHDAPLDYLSDAWTQYVIDRDGKVSKRYYALSGLWELRSNLRAGNIWVATSRRYANPGNVPYSNRQMGTTPHRGL